MKAALASVLVAAAAASASADLDVRAELGFGGRWVIDAVTPLTVSIRNSGPDPVLVRIDVTQGGMYASGEVAHHRVVPIAPGGDREELFLVPGAQLSGGSVRVQLEADERVPIHCATEPSAIGTLSFEVAGGGGQFSNDHIAYATRVLGVVGDPRGAVAGRLNALGLAIRAQQWSDDPAASIDAVGVRPEFLRLAPLGLEGLDALVLCDPDATAAADPAVLTALLDWTALGGTLVVSLGEHAGSFSASPLAAELPARWSGSRPTSYDELVPLLGAETKPELRRGPWAALVANAFAEPLEEDRHDGGPLRVERRLGMGRVVLLPYDLRLVLTTPSLDEAGARAVLSSFLADRPLIVAGEQDWTWASPGASIGRILRSNCFAPPALALVLLGICVYVCVVGPIDWFVLKRMHKQRLTTFTFLGAVVAFTLVAYTSSFFLFASNSRVNRVVFADLADAGQGGRQVLRYIDVAGHYSATGTTQELSYTTPFVVMPSSLPGRLDRGESGGGSEVHVGGNDPFRPKALLPVSFRSQRVARVAGAGTLGTTIEVEWQGQGVRVVNGLPVDLDDVAIWLDGEIAYSLGPVKSGETSRGGEFLAATGARDLDTSDVFEQYNMYRDSDAPIADETVRRFLEASSVGCRNRYARGGADEAMRKLGIERSAAFARGRALLVAHASKFPLPLPADDTDGETHVVLRKEVKVP